MGMSCFNSFLNNRFGFTVPIKTHATIYRMYIFKESIDIFNLIYKNAKIFLDRKMEKVIPFIQYKSIENE